MCRQIRRGRNGARLSSGNRLTVSQSTCTRRTIMIQISTTGQKVIYHVTICSASPSDTAWTCLDPGAEVQGLQLRGELRPPSLRDQECLSPE